MEKASEKEPSRSVTPTVPEQELPLEELGAYAEAHLEAEDIVGRADNGATAEEEKANLVLTAESMDEHKNRCETFIVRESKLLAYIESDEYKKVTSSNLPLTYTTINNMDDVDIEERLEAINKCLNHIQNKTSSKLLLNIISVAMIDSLVQQKKSQKLDAKDHLIKIIILLRKVKLCIQYNKDYISLSDDEKKEINQHIIASDKMLYKFVTEKDTIQSLFSFDFLIDYSIEKIVKDKQFYIKQFAKFNDVISHMLINIRETDLETFIISSFEQTRELFNQFIDKNISHDNLKAINKTLFNISQTIRCLLNDKFKFSIEDIGIKNAYVVEKKYADLSFTTDGLHNFKAILLEPEFNKVFSEMAELKNITRSSLKANSAMILVKTTHLMNYIFPLQDRIKHINVVDKITINLTKLNMKTMRFKEKLEAIMNEKDMTLNASIEKGLSTKEVIKVADEAGAFYKLLVSEVLKDEKLVKIANEQVVEVFEQEKDANDNITFLCNQLANLSFKKVEEKIFIDGLLNIIKKILVINNKMLAIKTVNKFYIINKQMNIKLTQIMSSDFMQYTVEQKYVCFAKLKKDLTVFLSMINTFKQAKTPLTSLKETVTKIKQTSRETVEKQIEQADVKLTRKQQKALQQRAFKQQKQQAAKQEKLQLQEQIDPLATTEKDKDSASISKPVIDDKQAQIKRQQDLQLSQLLQKYDKNITLITLFPVSLTMPNWEQLVPSFDAFFEFLREVCFFKHTELGKKIDNIPIRDIKESEQRIRTKVSVFDKKLNKLIKSEEGNTLYSKFVQQYNMLQDDSGDGVISNCEKSQRELSQFLSPLQATLTELNEAVTFYDDIIRFIVDISLDKSTIKLTIFKDEQISQKLERLKLENLTFLSLQEEIKMELNEELSSDEKLYFINGMLSHLSKITIANIPVLAKLNELCLVIKSEVALLQGKPQLTNLFEKLSACDISLFAPSIDPRSIDEDERLWSQEVNTISSQIRSITLQVVPEHYTNVKALNEICELICKCNHLSEAYLIQAP